jgi:hypothetical protein
LLTEYIQAAIDTITWKILDDGSFHAEISQLGLSASGAHLEECQVSIREALEDHIVFCIHRHAPLPAISGKVVTVNEQLDTQLLQK